VAAAIAMVTAGVEAKSWGRSKGTTASRGPDDGTQRRSASRQRLVYASGSRYLLFGARGTYSRALKGIIGISAGVDSELWTFRERGVAPGDDLTEEMRQLLKKKKAADSMDSSWSISVVPGGRYARPCIRLPRYPIRVSG